MPVRADRAARFVALTSPEREAEVLEEMFQRMTSRVEGVEGPEGRPEGLAAICAGWDVPYGRVLGWLMADAGRYEVYKRALEVAAHGLVAETVGIADSENQFTQRDRLRVATRFKVAEYHAPAMYRPRQTVDMNVKHEGWGERLRRARERLIEADSVVVPEDDPAEDDI